MTEELTPKQRQYQALGALRQIALHIGMIPSCKALAPSKEELVRRQQKVGREWLARCILVIFSENASPAAKAACCFILDYALYGWRDDLSPEALGYAITRDSPQVQHWRKQVFERDGHACTRCGSTERLHAHHIVHWADAPELRVVVDNGLTLCSDCHEHEHRKTNA